MDTVAARLADLPNAARRAPQFTRSTPGLGTSLGGISRPEHLDDLLAVAALPPLERQAYLGMYRKAE